MKALRAIMRSLSGLTAPAESAISTRSIPGELTDDQLQQVAGGGGALGGVIGSAANASKTRPTPDGSKGGVVGNNG